MQLGNRTVQPAKIGFLCYMPSPAFSTGTIGAQRRARRRISARVMDHVLAELGKYSEHGTLIEWPWGNLRQRDEKGRIRIFPFVTGFPFDGPEAVKQTQVRPVARTAVVAHCLMRTCHRVTCVCTGGKTVYALAASDDLVTRRSWPAGAVAARRTDGSVIWPIVVRFVRINIVFI